VTVLLLGDSHLARVDNVGRIGPQVTNRAVEGSIAAQLEGQLAGLDLDEYDVVVISIGTNDAAPWRDLTLPEFTSAIRDALTRIGDKRTVFMRSPGVETGVRGEELRLRMAEYAEAAASLFTRAGGEVINTPQLLAPLGAAAFNDDGLHLTARAYDVLLPAVAHAID